MIVLALVFCMLLFFIFAAVIYATGPSTEQAAVHRRIEQILSTHTRSQEVAAVLPSYLDKREDGFLGLLDERLAKKRLTHGLQRLIVQGQTSTTVAKILLISGVAAIATFAAVYLFFSMLLLAVGCGLLAGVIPTIFLQYKRAKRIAAFNNALPDAVEMFARALRVGNSLVASIQIVAEESVEPAKTEFAEVFKKQNYGLPLRDALIQMIDRVPSMDLQVVVTAILVQKDSGGNLVEILERTVAVIRDRLRIQREIKTHTAQGRMTGWILCLLPLAMLLCINLLNPGYSTVLFHDPTGQRLLYIGVGLLSLGAFLIHQIVKGIEV
jgi:tight adherence protein B